MPGEEIGDADRREIRRQPRRLNRRAAAHEDHERHVADQVGEPEAVPERQRAERGLEGGAVDHEAQVHHQRGQHRDRQRRVAQQQRQHRQLRGTRVREDRKAIGLGQPHPRLRHRDAGDEAPGDRRRHGRQHVDPAGAPCGAAAIRVLGSGRLHGVEPSLIMVRVSRQSYRSGAQYPRCGSRATGMAGGCAHPCDR